MAKAPLLTDHRCDKPMRRSKERCYIYAGTHWKCTKDCKNCMCAIFKDEYGGERHKGVIRNER